MRWTTICLLIWSCATASVEPSGDEADTDTDTDSDTDADTDSGVPVDTGPVADCAALTVVDCKAEPQCRVLKAFPILDIGGGEYCVDDSSVEVGCGMADNTCPPYTTWGAATSSPDTCYSFGDCQPDGWGACSDPSMRTTNGC
jgi:hypothetical protein